MQRPTLFCAEGSAGLGRAAFATSQRVHPPQQTQVANRSPAWSVAQALCLYAGGTSRQDLSVLKPLPSPPMPNHLSSRAKRTICFPLATYINPYFTLGLLVGLGRFELPTLGLGNQCSIHLSYSPSGDFITLRANYLSVISTPIALSTVSVPESLIASSNHFFSVGKERGFSSRNANPTPRFGCE